MTKLPLTVVSALSPGPDSSILSFCSVYNALEANKLQTTILFLQLPNHELSCSRTVTSLVKILQSGPTHVFVQFDHAGYTVRRSAQQAKLDAGKVHQKPLVETLQQLRTFMLKKI